MSDAKLVPFVRPPDKVSDAQTQLLSVDVAVTTKYVDELLTGMATAAINGAIGFLEAVKGANVAISTPPRRRRAATPDTEYMDEKELCAKIGISSVTATKWRAKADGPPFVKLANRMIRYKRTEVDAWLAASRK